MKYDNGMPKPILEADVNPKHYIRKEDYRGKGTWFVYRTSLVEVKYILLDKLEHVYQFESLLKEAGYKEQEIKNAD